MCRRQPPTSRSPLHPQRLWCVLLLWPFFFSAGHVSSRQAAIATSSRWLARVMGFCLLQPILRKILPTCWGVYVTPNSFAITRTTRGHVQRSPRNPWASAPCPNNTGNRATSSSLKRGFGPGALRRYSPSTPSSSALLNHWLTAPRVTPNASAIRAAFQPCFLSSHARNRRASRQSSGRFFIMPVAYHKYNQEFRKLFSCQ